MCFHFFSKWERFKLLEHQAMAHGSSPQQPSTSTSPAAQTPSSPILCSPWSGWAVPWATPPPAYRGPAAAWCPALTAWAATPRVHPWQTAAAAQLRTWVSATAPTTAALLPSQAGTPAGTPAWWCRSCSPRYPRTLVWLERAWWWTLSTLSFPVPLAQRTPAPSLTIE